MRARVSYYVPWNSTEPGYITVDVPDPFSPSWKSRAERDANAITGERPDFTWIIADHNPLHYDCTDCGSPEQVRCLKRGTVLGYFHDARLIEAGVKEPPPKRWPSYFMQGSKHNWHRRHETAGSQFNRKRKNRQERHKAKQELHNV